MAMNGSFVDGTKPYMPEEVQILMSQIGSRATLMLDYDVTAAVDTLMRTLHAPRIDPVRLHVRSIVACEFKFDLTQVSAVIEKCPEIVVLWLERNEFRNTELQHLEVTLQTCLKLEALCLRRQNIGDIGAQTLSKSLVKWKNKSLKSLYLGYCSIGADGARAVSNALLRMPCAASVTALDLTANFLKAQGATNIGQLLAENRRIRVLRLGGNGIEDTGLKQLSDSLCRNSVLENLVLDENQLTSEGMKYMADALKKNITLTCLSLQSNSIGPEGAMNISQGIRSNTVLQNLLLGRNQMGSSGVEHLASVLSTCTQLLTLSLVDNAVTCQGASFLAGPLSKNTTLKLLDLEKNPIRDEGRDRLLAAMQIRRNHGILRMQNHCYGTLPKPAPVQAAKVETPKIETKPKTPDAPKDKGSGGPLKDLFVHWSASGEGQKGSQKGRSMDMKEFLEMLKEIKLMPNRISKAQAQELFKHSNRASAVADDNTAELDFDEFSYAIRKLAEKVNMTIEQLLQVCKPPLPVTTTASKSPGRRSSIVAPNRRRSSIASVGSHKVLPLQPLTLPSQNELQNLFKKCSASGTGQSKKRAQSMDAKEFVSALKSLGFLPDRVSKTFVMETYQRAKQHAIQGDQTELDWEAFSWALNRLVKQIGPQS